MRAIIHYLLLVTLMCVASNGLTKSRNSCSNEQSALQVLGSGGPIADDRRASSAYLLWLDKKARILIDAGGGVFIQFAKSGANFESLDLIALTHFHADHASGLISLLKSAYFSQRKEPLTISGPFANTNFPDTSDFLHALLAPKTGAYRYLSGYLTGSDGHFLLKPTTVKKWQSVLKRPNFTVDALPVPHGTVPSLSYRIRLKEGKTLVISGDQNGLSADFIDFAKNSDLLVMPLAISQQAGKIGRRLHMTPLRVGQIAAQSHTKTLLLSHLMQRAIQSMPKNLKLIKQNYKGQVKIAKDFLCYPL